MTSIIFIFISDHSFLTSFLTRIYNNIIIQYYFNMRQKGARKVRKHKQKRNKTKIYMQMRVTPPFGTQYSGGLSRYAVRKGSVRTTHKSCYIVRRHQFFIKKHKKCDTLIWEGWKLGNLTRKHMKANVWKNDCACACNRLSFYLLHVNGNAKNGFLLLNGTQYARLKNGSTLYARPK